MKYCTVLILCVGAVLNHAISEVRFKREAAKDANVRRAVNACQMYNQQFDYKSAESFSWMAALGYIKRKTNSTYFQCGGTIISNKFILTAAHCVKRTNEPTVVRLGSKTLADGDGQDYRIQEILRHPEYSFIAKQNNIALIRLVEPIVFTKKISPACLHIDSSDIDSHTKMIVTGWGYTPELSHQSAMLKEIYVNTIPLSECNATLIDFNRVPNLSALRNGISENQYCTNEAVNGPCQGDSGGPLQLFPSEHSSLATVVGILSFGFTCGTEKPSVYTRVANYLDWVEPIVWP